MVEIFKTTIQEPYQANAIVSLLKHSFPGLKINIHLDECEKILRAEGSQINAEQIISVVNQAGFECEVLEDAICKNSDFSL